MTDNDFDTFLIVICLIAVAMLLSGCLATLRSF